jgi:hypothetical protein
MPEPFQLVRPPKRVILKRDPGAASDRRYYLRHTGRALRLEIEDQPYETLDWSLGGFRIGAFHRTLARGDRLDGKLGPVGSAKDGTFVAEVRHVAPDGKIGLRWAEITSTSFFALSRFRAS